MTYAETLHIPMNEVFKSENLDRISTDKKVIVTCKEGTRAAIIALALRQTGFNNVYIMKGGIDAMAKYLSGKTAF